MQYALPWRSVLMRLFDVYPEYIQDLTREDHERILVAFVTSMCKVAKLDVEEVARRIVAPVEEYKP